MVEFTFAGDTRSIEYEMESQAIGCGFAILEAQLPEPNDDSLSSERP